MTFPGTIGAPGEDSYQIAVNHGYKGTYEEYQHMIAIMPDVLMKATDFVDNIDDIPTEDSDHLVKSGGVYSSIKNVETLVNDKSLELNTKIEEAKSEIENDINPKLDNLDAKIDTTKSDLQEEMNSKLESLEKEINDNINPKIDDLEDKIDSAKEEIADDINPKLDELNNRITEVESDLNGSLNDLEKIVIENKNDSDNSISDLEKSFDDKMQEVLDNLNNKANVSDIPTDYVTPDVIDGVYSAIDNIDTTVSADEVATVLDADMIAGVVNGSLKIEGTAISDDAIATRHLIANSVSSTAIASGAIIAEKIAAGAITADKIDAGAIKSEHIYGSALNGLTIEDGAGKWKLNKDGSGYLASQNIKWDTSGNVTFGNGVTIAWSDEQTSLVDNAQSTANSAKSAANKAQTDANTANSGLTTTNAAVKALQTRMSSAEENIANKISASEVVDALTDDTDSKTAIAGLINGSKLIEGSAIKKGAIGTEQIASNYVYAGEVAANKISAGTFDSDVVYAGSIKASQITSGKITAGQIDSTDLHVKAANIDGTLTAGQIDASNITVNLANVTGTLSASKITGDISGLTIQSGNAWILNKDGSGHVANGNLSWDSSGNVVGTGAFTGATYNGSITKQPRNSNDSNKTIELVHQVGLFNSNFGSMYTYKNGYAIPKYITVMVNPINTYTETQPSTGNTVSYIATNIIEVIDNLIYNGVKQKLNPYEYKIINTGDTSIHIYKGGRSIGVIPTNSYTNIFVYTDNNNVIQCYFQS